MSQSSSRGFKGKNTFSFERGFADMPDNCGNRKTFEEIKIPPDDMGNNIDQILSAPLVHDNLGNSLDEEPSHQRSGILSYLVEERTTLRRPYREFSHQRASIAPKKTRNFAKIIFNESPQSEQKKLSSSLFDSPEKYLSGLTKEFSRSLGEKSGMPFSFSMKPMADHRLDEKGEYEDLLSIQNTIEQILKNTAIEASIRLARYHTTKHRFAVFFLNPLERDPVKNKELISALRQTLKLHLLNFPMDPINVLLVLANAEKVIEEHLYKVGAKKVE